MRARDWRIGEPANPAEPEVDLRLVDANGTARSKHENLPIFERGFIRLIDRLTSAGKTVYIVGALPEPMFDVPHRLFIQRFGLAEQAGPIKVSDTQIRHATIMRIFGRFAHSASVRFVWPQSALCNSVDCPVIENGEPLYFDQDHLSINGALKTSRLYDGIFEQSHSD